MGMKSGTCPQCERHVEFQSVASAAGILYKCSNCWYHLDAGQVKNVEQLSKDLLDIDKQREEILRAAR